MKIKDNKFLENRMRFPLAMNSQWKIVKDEQKELIDELLID